MSTSPSWFDQEKFSRLVKKVGTRPLPDMVSGLHGAEAGNRSPSGGGMASTARISLVSKPPALLSEHRALPALPRRTAPLPNLKSLFSRPAPPAVGEAAKEEAAVPTGDTPREADSSVPLYEDEGELAEVWHKMSLLNEELAHSIQERDQAVNEGALLREQLRHALEEGKESESKTQDFTLLTEERDRIRREYAELRKEFETLKHEQASKEEAVRFRKEWEQQLEALQQKLEEKDKEIAALKASSGASDNGDEKLKQEAASLREQLARARDEASVAQRGLALSQKALQQTRDTLREATEGTSLSRHNFDNLKNECATLAQQVSLLQTQNEQLSRDLAAGKTAKTTKSLGRL